MDSSAPTGSGKTTTMRMIVNIFYPDRGSIRVFGGSASGARSDRSVICRRSAACTGRWRCAAAARILRRIARRPQGSTAEVDGVARRLGLAQCAEQQVETLSKGMSQKVQFIAAVVPEPKLLILDEPFTGLDPVSADAIRAAVLELRRAAPRSS